MAKWISLIFAALLVFIGVVWVLQGFNVLGGSFMSGQRFWAGMGGMAIVVGLALLIWNLRRKGNQSP